MTTELQLDTQLLKFNDIRERVLSNVVTRTAAEFGNGSLDAILSEALYSERQRLKRTRPNIFTKKRYQSDQRVWGSIQRGLLSPAAIVDRKQLLNQGLAHFADEVGGHFNERVYRFATHAVPFGFSWLLNAASVQRFVPWGMTRSLESSLKLTGEIPMLRKLAQKGTILLVPTHQSNLDSILVGYLVFLMGLPPFAYGAGLNLFSNPVLSFFMGNLGAYTVDRQKSGNALYKALLKNYSTAILHEGIHSIFFPGGGRSRSGAVENKLKLGLLGTGLEAQALKLAAGHPKPNVYVVPMVMSYHFVLEATSLIEDYLAEAGKHRFIITDDESWQVTRVAKFFWKFFSAQSSVTVRVGRALDVFGNFVDDEGQSIGPNGTTIDPKEWLSTRGELKLDPSRDHEYTRELGDRLIDRFHKENIVLTSHLVAFSFFEKLRKQYPDLDLYRLVRLSPAQRTMPYEGFLKFAEEQHTKVREAADRGQLFLAPELQTSDTNAWVEDGLKQLGMYHDASVVKRNDDGTVTTEDLNLVYYYRNRLAGYGLSEKALGLYDRKGFLA